MAYISGLHLIPVIMSSSPFALAKTNLFHKTLMISATCLVAMS